ncbi:MAG: hypothetical protein Q8P18_15475 [Pseudomonadota bacterium]|nr:hypothetical protein [Pseudomonadota bacterium]
MHPPPSELSHTVAGQRIAAHARASDLFFSHFEHHVDLEGPDAWQPAARPDLGERATWRAGVLPEAKFRNFRLDRMVASFHPAHGPKWSVHELCHRLVGWAWHPGASPLFVATAARLAELAPVALWYFYDEIGARRCARHAGSDPRFDLRCAACEALEGGPAAGGAGGDARLREEGDRYVAAELAAIAETLRLGRPVSHRWATLELCTDGLAWAAAHGRRLASPAFHGWVERFVPDGTGRHESLEALTERVGAVIAAARDGAPLEPWVGRRERWIAQDVGWRLTTIHADCEGDAAHTLDRIVVGLAHDLDVADAIEAYRPLAAAFELPEVEDAFAVGYDLPGGLGRSARQIGAGLATVCPGALALLGDAAPRTIAAFTAKDVPIRSPLGRRFSAHLAAAAGAADAAELAALESAVVHAPPMDPAVATLREGPPPDGPVRLAPGVALLRSSRDWRRWLGGRPRPPEGRRAPKRALTLAVVREPDGEVALWEIDAAVAAVGDTPAVPDVPADVRAALLAAGVWAPEAWPTG